MGRTARHRSDRGFSRLPAIALSLVAVLVLGAAGALIASHHSGKSRGGAFKRSRSTTAREMAAKGHKGKAPAPLTVSSITPASGSSEVPWSAPITVKFSAPLAGATALPSLSPSVPGAWERIGPSTLEFKPVGQYTPYSEITVTVPAGTAAAHGKALQQSVSSSFTVAGASVLRLQELLAELGYLPLTFTPQAGAAPAPASGVPTSAPAVSAAPPAPDTPDTTVLTAPGAGTTSDIEPASPGDIPLEPLAGTFSWRFTNIPPSLAALWQAGEANVITTGAVMTFEAAHGLTTDGEAGPTVWRNLLEAAAQRQLYSEPYDYVYVSEASPEYLTLWRDGVNIFTTLVNTGIPQAPTQPGTWPVYARYRTTTMKGTNPDGQKYSDPGIPWVSYFHGGDALHGFLRAQYGFPQSLGCVEMPYNSAHTVWPYTPIGTLVTVE